MGAWRVEWGICAGRAAAASLWRGKDEAELLSSRVLMPRSATLIHWRPGRGSSLQRAKKSGRICRKCAKTKLRERSAVTWATVLIVSEKDALGASVSKSGRGHGT